MYLFHALDPSTSAAAQQNYPSQSHQTTQTVRYECSKCDSLFTSRMYLHQHEATTHNRIFHCPFCSALFSNKPDFKVHVTAHSEKKYLPCAFCRKVFNEIDEYTAHVKEHREPFMFSCDKCPALFSQLSLLRIHNAVHLKKKYVHTIPKITKCPRKKFSRIKKQKLNLNDDSVPDEIHVSSVTFGSQTSDIAEPEVLAPVVFASSAIPMTESACVLPGSHHRVVSENNLPVRNANRDKNVRKIGRPREKKVVIVDLEEPSVSPSKTTPDLVASSSQTTDETSVPNRFENVRNRDRRLENKHDESFTLVASSSSNYSGHTSEKAPMTKKFAIKREVSKKNRIKNVTASVQLNSTSSNTRIVGGKNHSVDSNMKRNLRPRNPVENKITAGNVHVSVKADYNFRSRMVLKSYVESSKSSGKSSSSRKSSSGGFFMCLSCKRVFITYSAVNHHKILHAENRGIRCVECGGLFAGPGNLVTHQRSMHRCTD